MHSIKVVGKYTGTPFLKKKSSLIVLTSKKMIKLVYKWCDSVYIEQPLLAYVLRQINFNKKNWLCKYTGLDVKIMSLGAKPSLKGKA